MKKIDSIEYKHILYGILHYIDEQCRKNNIAYSLCGGSLIGAVREGKIIEWDDDIDIILTIEEYKKIVDIIKKDNHPRYKILNSHDCNFPFTKIIDTKTVIKEPSMKSSYSAFVDVFFYIPMPNDDAARLKQFKKLKRIMKLSNETAINYNHVGLMRKTARALRNFYIRHYASRHTKKQFNKIIKNAETIKNPKYQVACWPIYSYEKELQKTSDITAGYIDTNFGPIKSMISKNYDAILSTTFGDYMTPPPINQRRTHGIEAYWKED